LIKCYSNFLEDLCLSVIYGTSLLSCDVFLMSQQLHHSNKEEETLELKIGTKHKFYDRINLSHFVVGIYCARCAYPCKSSSLCEILAHIRKLWSCKLARNVSCVSYRIQQISVEFCDCISFNQFGSRTQFCQSFNCV